MAEVRPPSVRLVSSALRRAGLPKGEHGGKVINYAVTVSGWAVGDKSGGVTVAHWSRLEVGKDASEERDAVARYAQVIRAASSAAEEDKRSRVLRVHAARKGGNRG